MVSIITTLVVSVLLGSLSPIVSPGVNFPLETGKNLFSQITSKLQKKPLSEINPMESLGNVTLPIDSMFKAIGDRVGGLDGIKGFLRGRTTVPNGLSKSSLVSSFKSGDTSGAWQVLGMLKSAFILTANILLAVIDIVASLLKGILSLLG